MIHLNPQMPLQSPAPDSAKSRAQVEENFAQIFMSVVMSALNEAQSHDGLLNSRDSQTFRTMLNKELLQQKGNWQALGQHLGSGLHTRKTDL